MSPEPRAERLQKVLSRRGVASRREAEDWILAGRVRVNGELARELGVKVDPEADRVEVDGRPIPIELPRTVVLLHKPPGYVTTLRDPHAERTIMELLKGLGRRVYPVGRLDRDTRGVLLLTDDGDLAQALLHPSGQVEKVYQVTVAGDLSEEALGRLASGVELEDGPTAPVSVWGVTRERGRTRFRMTLKEGRKRQIRRMVRAVGTRVVDLTRISFAGLTVGRLPEGEWRPVSAREVEALRRAAARSAPGAGPAGLRRPGGSPRRSRRKRTARDDKRSGGRRAR